LINSVYLTRLNPSACPLDIRLKQTNFVLLLKWIDRVSNTNLNYHNASHNFSKWGNFRRCFHIEWKMNFPRILISFRKMYLYIIFRGKNVDDLIYDESRGTNIFGRCKSKNFLLNLNMIIAQYIFRYWFSLICYF
jgi:hypothetical protein